MLIYYELFCNFAPANEKVRIVFYRGRVPYCLQ